MSTAVLLLLAACASPERSQNADSAVGGSPNTADTSTNASSLRRDYPVRPFPTQTFYDLLVAEVAGTRGELGLALENYRKQALATRDPGVIARAVSTASYQKNNEALQELGILWAEVEPLSMQARNMAFYAQAQRANFDLAFEHAEYLLSQNNGKYMVLLPSYTAELDEEHRLHLLEQYIAGAQNHPDNRDLLLGKTLLLAQLARIDDALSTAHQILTEHPDDQPARLVAAQILHKDGRHEAAIDELEEGLKHAPKSQQLQLQLVRFVAASDLPLAIDKMSALAEQEPANDKFKLALALLHRENHDLEPAQEIYRTLIADQHLSSQAHFQLAIMAEQSQEPDTALQHYRKVSNNDLFLQATVRISQILASRGQLNDARLYLHKLRLDYPNHASAFYQIESQLLIEQQGHQSAQTLLDEGLAEDPDNIELLYSRSLIHEKLGNIAATEKDLRAIIEHDTNNASALNALGYTLANRTERYDEALELIQRAQAIKPNDPAIRDSLGWVHYKLGEYDEALGHLRAAMNTMPDPEVAAHLGEVLWATGAEEEARSIWQNAIDDNPGSEFLLNTLKRLNVQL
ncbi:MAG: tetratricopeptide repeat protein [Gammaproteobacteria bacterium]|nr:tetratricopeptide repeat protein [Gammaproteobacteria bacterium]MBQ0839557.1 tetratricopeptide repeat protein [Gammaproteobacteria bacterium]